MSGPAFARNRRGFASVTGRRRLNPMSPFPFGIMASALIRAGLIDGKADAGLAFVVCFICETEVLREHAIYDEEFNLWECRPCRLKWE